MASTLPGGPVNLNYSRARILGGCTNHNDCAFLIPPDSDFDEWERRGAAGWDAGAVRPYFRRVEERVGVYQFEDPNPVSRAFVQAGQEIGLPLIDFRQRIVPGVGWFPLNSHRRSPRLHLRCLSASSRPVAEEPGGVDADHGAAARDRRTAVCWAPRRRRAASARGAR